MSPITNDSAESQSRQISTPPSSPPVGSPDDTDKKPDEQGETEAQNNAAMEEEEDDDDEDMGTKAKALTNLLKTSSVCLQDCELDLPCTKYAAGFRSSLLSWQTK